MSRPPRSLPPRLLAAFALWTVASVGAAQTPAERGSAWGVGVEAAAFDRSYEIAGSEVSAESALAGVAVSAHYSPGFRLEARVLAGGVEYRVDGGSASSHPALYTDAEATWGVLMPGGARLYGGVGAQHVRADLDDDVEERSTAVYLPLGIAKPGALHGGWRAVTSLEAQLVVAERQEVVMDAGEAEFDHYGGFGVELAARFSHPDTPVRITPYLRHVAVRDSRTEDFGVAETRISDLTHTALGLQVLAAF